MWARCLNCLYSWRRSHPWFSRLKVGILINLMCLVWYVVSHLLLQDMGLPYTRAHTHTRGAGQVSQVRSGMRCWGEKSHRAGGDAGSCGLQSYPSVTCARQLVGRNWRGFAVLNRALLVGAWLHAGSWLQESDFWNRSNPLLNHCDIWHVWMLIVKFTPAEAHICMCHSDEKGKKKKRQMGYTFLLFTVGSQHFFSYLCEY